ncbi:MAG TPA: hypothetical protein VM889_14525 [Candidatus Thermoplasmatota archaeon]|nr:hypothetical protein [Candidatus Thermoplasmatota archaeon]
MLRRTLAFDPGHPEDWTAWVARLSVGALALAFIWTGPFGPAVAPADTRALLGGFALAGVVAGALLNALPGTGLRAMRVVETAWTVAFGLHLLGHTANLYEAWPPYDLVVHGAGGALAAFAALALLGGTRWFYDRDALTPLRVFWFVVATVSAVGVAVEIGEYTADNVLGTREQTDPVQPRLDDTMTDILAESVTGVAVASWAAWRVRGSGRRLARGATAQP